MVGNVCVPCAVQMRCKKNEIFAVVMDGEDYDAVFAADLWQCPSCDHKVLAGFGRKPLTLGHENCGIVLEDVDPDLIYRYKRE